MMLTKKGRRPVRATPLVSWLFRRRERQLRLRRPIDRGQHAVGTDRSDEAVERVITDRVRIAAVAVGVVFGAAVELRPHDGGTDAKNGGRELDGRGDDCDLAANPTSGVLRPSPFCVAPNRLPEVQAADGFDGLGA